MRIRHIERFLLALQLALGLRVVARMLLSAGGTRIEPTASPSPISEGLAVIVPVLNEFQRLAPCLAGLSLQGPEVAEIIVVDGGSTDGTQLLVQDWMGKDARIRLVDASPIPTDWNGKAWGLQVGLRSIRSGARWVLTVDADVHPRDHLARTLLSYARQEGVDALSIATMQELTGTPEALLHPSLLTTLVYRFGIPGKPIRHVHEVQANGQCFLFQRAVLEQCQGFTSVRASICEDVTIARLLVKAGYRVGFYEAHDLVSVKMYENWREMWHNWTRSLPMHDQFAGPYTALGWLEVALIQTLPLPLCVFMLIMRKQAYALLALNGILSMIRIGVLFGTARTYVTRPWTYWLSPLCDIPVTVQLARKALQRKHVWRGRLLVRRGKL